MKKVFLNLLLMIALPSLGVAQAQNGNGYTVVNDTYSDPSWTLDFAHPCTGEIITLSGTLHTNTQNKMYSDGSLDVKGSVNVSNASGTDSDGNVYRYSDNRSFNNSFGPPVLIHL
ncbi:MAG: hypothetical protein ACI959_000291 [Limisphaerales bacterium]